MHRHGYQGTKFGRTAGQRRALLKSLSEALIIYESVETTVPKAKELKIYFEGLMTYAKKGDLASRRRLLTKLSTKASAHKLVDEIAPRYTSRSSGHLTLQQLGYRRGDNARMAKVAFVEAGSKKPTKTTDKSQEAPVEAELSKTDKVSKGTGQKLSGSSKITTKTSANVVAKRSGVRGNR